MYTNRNFKTKKELKEAVAARLEYLAACERGEGEATAFVRPVTYYQPGPFGGNEPRNGKFAVEGPHYPKPHRWYAACTAENGEIVKVS
jgi:hypothetical protein